MSKLERAADLAPEKWLLRIEELRKLGRIDEAKASLAEFRKRYPDFPTTGFPAGLGAAMSPPNDDALDPPPALPREPEAGACCQSGCDPCVYDHYRAAVDRYERALAAWKSRQAARRAGPESSIPHKL